MQGKYKALKGKVNKSPPKENYLKKIENLEKLTEKQQREIGRIIQTYDKELHAQHKDNNRLRENNHQILQKLSTYNTQLLQKDTKINELTANSQRYQAEIEALKKVNKLIGKEREKLADIPRMNSKISQT